jgi:probable F420-dependent oxidoreductase
MVLPQRNPMILAKEVATLDHLSGGRVELGVGVGWMKEEFDALGVSWDHRGARTDEYVKVMKNLWAGPEAEFNGEFVKHKKITCAPRPVGGDVRIVTGGDSDVAIRRAARISDGYFPGTIDPQKLKNLIAQLATAAKAEGRSIDDIEVNAMLITDYSNPADGIKQLEDIGVDRVMVPAFFFVGPDGMKLLENFAKAAIK